MMSNNKIEGGLLSHGGTTSYLNSLQLNGKFHPSLSFLDPNHHSHCSMEFESLIERLNEIDQDLSIPYLEKKS